MRKSSTDRAVASARPARRSLALLWLVLCALPLGAPAPARADEADRAALLAREIASLSDAERRARVEPLSAAERGELLAALDLPVLLGIGERAAQALGTYSMKLHKDERVRGKLVGAQTMAVWVSPQPFAARLRFLEGPGKGRNVLYNAAIRPDQVRGREGGFLGVAGGIWIGIDSRLTRSETNHRITDMGFAAMMQRLRAGVERASASAQPFRKDEGMQKDGLYCMRLAFPPATAESSAQTHRLCLDPVLGLPVHVEITDGSGMLEWATYSEIERGLTLPPDHFTPEGAGI